MIANDFRRFLVWICESSSMILYVDHLEPVTPQNRDTRNIPKADISFGVFVANNRSNGK